MTPLLVLAGHEIRRSWRSPAFFFTLALFLLYQGIVFSVTIALRTHPLSPPGPLLAPFFGGPFWFWPMLLLVVVQLSHDAISRERAARTLDALRASRLTPGGIAAAKFLSVFVSWLLFWAATLPLLAAAWLLFPADTVWELGPILTGYLGVALIGAAALAVGILFSSVTADARLSGMLTFLVLFSFVLLKILTHPAFGIVHDPAILKPLMAVNFLDMLDRFSRGRVHLPDLAFLGVITASCVALAGRMLDEDFRRARKTPWHAADITAWTLLAVFAVAWSFRVDVVWDVHSPTEFDPRLVQLIGRSEPVKLYLFAGAGPTADVISPISELEAQLNRLCRTFSNLSWERVPAVDESPRVRRLAEKFGLDLGALRSDASGLMEGRLVVATDRRHHVILLADLFVVDVREEGVIFQGIALQSALAGALQNILDSRETAWCFTRAHGENSILETRSTGLSRLARALSFAGIQTREIDLASEIPASCRLVVAGGPQTGLSPLEEENLDRAIRRGAGFVLAMRGSGSLPESWRRFPGACGIRVTDDAAGDPSAPVRPPSAEEFFVEWPGRNMRLAVFLPRVLELSGDAKPLLAASGFALRFQEDSARSVSVPPVLAAASGLSCPGRMLVLGFLDVFFNDRLSPAGISSNAEVSWLIAQLRETAREPPQEDLPLSPVEHHRLRLTPDLVRKLHVFALLLLPSAALLAGIWAARRRR